MITWEELAMVVEENGYDASLDWDEESFICPFCNEPVYESDYPEIEDYFCPICHEVF